MKIFYEVLGVLLYIVGIYLFVIIAFTSILMSGQLTFENQYQLFSTSLLTILVGTHFFMRGWDGSDFCRPFSKVVEFVLLIIYLASLLYLVFQQMTSSVDDTLVTYFEDCTLVPGHALFSVLGTDTKTLISTGAITGYFIKNLLLFLPLGFLLPCIFRIMQNWFLYLFTLILISVASELMMNMLSITILDVDTILLHLLGGLFSYALCKCSPIENFLTRWYAID